MKHTSKPYPSWFEMLVFNLDQDAEKLISTQRQTFIALRDYLQSNPEISGELIEWKNTVLADRRCFEDILLAVREDLPHLVDDIKTDTGYDHDECRDREQKLEQFLGTIWKEVENY